MTYSTIISWFQILGRINPAAWDWIVPQGPVLSPAASKVAMGLVLKSVAGQASLEKFGPRLAAAGRKLFAEGTQELSFDDEPDICPPYPWFHLPHGSHPGPTPPDPWPIINRLSISPIAGPSPEPWLNASDELNPQPLPPAYAGLVLKQIASLIENKDISAEVAEIAGALTRR